MPLYLSLIFGDLRLENLHFAHRLQVHDLQREQRQIDEEREDDDGPAVVVDELIVQYRAAS